MAQSREPYRVVRVNDTSNLYSLTDGYEDNYRNGPFDLEEYTREKASDDDENSSLRVIEFFFSQVLLSRKLLLAEEGLYCA